MGLNNEYATAERPYLVFDIETCPMPTCREFLVEPIEAPSNYKDPAKIAAYIEEKKKTQIDQAALDLDLCEIVAIAGAFEDSSWAQTRERNSEEEMLRGFWRFVDTMHREGGLIIGFNCLGFDLPVLLRRSMYLAIPTPRISIDKYRHDGIVDLADVLTFGGKTKWRSLAFYCKRFGIPYDNTDGAEVPQMVADGKWADIEMHVVEDVEATHALARRIGVIAAPVQPELEPAAVL